VAGGFRERRNVQSVSGQERRANEIAGSSQCRCQRREFVGTAGEAVQTKDARPPPDDLAA